MVLLSGEPGIGKSRVTQELRERVRALRELGFNEFSVHITNGQEHMLEEWSDLLEGV